MAATIQAIPYITKTGDRWDLLAWRFYGDPARYLEILEANFYVAISAVLPHGIQLFIPILPPPAPASRPLAPWERST
jgi:phage tail protein X